MKARNYIQQLMLLLIPVGLLTACTSDEEGVSIRDNNWAADISIRDSYRSRKYQLRDSNEFHNTITYVIAFSGSVEINISAYVITSTQKPAAKGP